jgi:hypothetical protein
VWVAAVACGVPANDLLLDTAAQELPSRTSCCCCFAWVAGTEAPQLAWIQGARTVQGTAAEAHAEGGAVVALGEAMEGVAPKAGQRSRT